MLRKTEQSDSVQFRMAEELEKRELLLLRRGQSIKVKAEATQSNMSDKGKIQFQEILFTSGPVSISIVCLEEGQVATITFSVEDEDQMRKIVASDLFGRDCELTFG